LKNIYIKIIYTFAALFISIFILTGCPLPYKYTPEGYPGTSTGSDPTTPDISAAPVALYTESSGRTGAVADGESATTSSDTDITFSSASVGAVIYYTIDGTTPDPRSSNTRKYAPGSPLRLAVGNPSVDLSSASVTARATAIGPNMKPSLISTVTVSVQYPRAAAPTFSLAPAAYVEDQYVALSTTTPGADIYYTMVAGNGPAPRPVPGQQGTYEYSEPILVAGPNNIWTLSAIAVKDQLIASAASSSTYSIAYTACATPFFTPGAAVYENDVTLVLHGQENSTIHYTTDGSDPVIGSSPYAQPNSGMTLPGSIPTDEGRVVMKAQATAPGRNPSGINTAEYVFQVGQVQPAIPEGTYYNAFDLSLSTDTEGAEIYYTTDGSAPYPGGTLYHSPFAVSSTRTVRAVAVKDGYLRSSEWQGTYAMRTATPIFNKAGGDYYEDFDITISCATSDSWIYITSDGSDPSDPSNTNRNGYFNQPISYSVVGARALTLRACATRAGFGNSAVNTVLYYRWDMPNLRAIAPSGSIEPPNVMPSGAPSPEYWTGYFGTGWYYGGYTYVIWDPDNQNWGSFAIAAYNSDWNKVGEWLISGNRYVYSVSIAPANGSILVYGQSGVTAVSWANIKPPFN
jgi:hypothetical protein